MMTHVPDDDLARIAESGWWWSMASNPACEDWCELEHHPAEFAASGLLTCARSFGVAVVERSQEASEERLLRMNRSPLMISTPKLETASVVDADRLLEDLDEAVAFVREVHA